MYLDSIKIDSNLTLIYTDSLSNSYLPSKCKQNVLFTLQTFKNYDWLNYKFVNIVYKIPKRTPSRLALMTEPSKFFIDYFKRFREPTYNKTINRLMTMYQDSVTNDSQFNELLEVFIYSQMVEDNIPNVDPFQIDCFDVIWATYSNCSYGRASYYDTLWGNLAGRSDTSIKDFSKYVRSNCIGVKNAYNN